MPRSTGSFWRLQKLAKRLRLRVFASARDQGTNVRLEVEAHLAVGARHVELDRAALEFLDPCQHLGALLGIRTSMQRALDQSQLAVESQYTVLHLPLIESRQH